MTRIAARKRICDRLARPWKIGNRPDSDRQPRAIQCVSSRSMTAAENNGGLFLEHSLYFWLS